MSNPKLQEYVKRHLRACQLKQLSILEEVDRICRKHDIDYWLDGGTLLGAVRHKGFIPWDDDIDIAMTAEGLEKFCRMAPAELSENLFLQTPKTDPDSKEPIVKIRDLDSLYIEGEDILSANYEKGLYIDIFPFVPCPSMPYRLFRRWAKGYAKSYSIMHHPHYYSWRSAAEWLWFGSKELLYGSLLRIFRLLCPCNTYLMNVPNNNGYGIRHHRNSIFPLSTISFEGKAFRAPGNPDAYLSDLYKNYMDIPPVEKRKIHAVFLLPRLSEPEDK